MKENSERKKAAAEAIRLQKQGVPQEEADYQTGRMFNVRTESIARYRREFPNADAEIREISKCEIRSHKLKTKKTPRQIWERALKENSERADDEENIRYLSISIKESKPICFALMGDGHFDDPRAALHIAERDAKIIAETDGMYCGDVGDDLNQYIKTKEKYPNFDDPSLPIRERFSLFEHFVSMIGMKTWFMLAGNHAYYAYGRSGFLFERQVSENKQIHFSKDELRLFLKLGQEDYIGYFSHTYWGHSRLNPMHDLLRAARHAMVEVRPDIVGLGHTHDTIAMSLALDGKMFVGLKAAGYKPNAADFEGQRHYPQIICQNPAAIFFPNEHRILPVDSIPLAADILKHLRKKK